MYKFFKQKSMTHTPCSLWDRAPAQQMLVCTSYTTFDSSSNSQQATSASRKSVDLETIVLPQHTWRKTMTLRYLYEVVSTTNTFYQFSACNDLISKWSNTRWEQRFIKKNWNPISFKSFKNTDNPLPQSKRFRLVHHSKTAFLQNKENRCSSFA